jgi:hypothetical protein
MRKFYILARTNNKSEDTINLTSTILSNVRCEPVYEHGKDYKGEILVDGNAPDDLSEQNLIKEVTKLLSPHSFRHIQTEFRPAKQTCDEYTYMKAS